MPMNDVEAIRIIKGYGSFEFLYLLHNRDFPNTDADSLAMAGTLNNDYLVNILYSCGEQDFDVFVSNAPAIIYKGIGTKGGATMTPLNTANTKRGNVAVETLTIKKGKMSLNIDGMNPDRATTPKVKIIQDGESGVLFGVDEGDIGGIVSDLNTMASVVPNTAKSKVRINVTSDHMKFEMVDDGVVRASTSCNIATADDTDCDITIIVNRTNFVTLLKSAQPIDSVVLFHVSEHALTYRESRDDCEIVASLLGYKK